MKRILFISQYLNRGGTEAFMMNVFRGIDKCRFIIDFLLYSKQETDYSHEVEKNGGRIFRVTCRKESILAWHKELNSFFKMHAKEYHAIHFCGNSLTSIAPIYYAYKYGVPVRAVHAHSSSVKGLHNRLLHILNRKYATKISTHHLACSIEAGQWFFNNTEAEIIKNGVETSHFAYNKSLRERIRTELNIKNTTKVIGHVGRFSAEKNHSFIIDVFSAYNQANPNSQLVLIGIGPLLKDAETKVKKLGIERNVLFLGERKNVAELMQAMDLFLMPSTFEGLPFVLVEAQCAGLPCVISDVISNDIRITRNIVYQSLTNDKNAWAQTIKQTLSNFTREDTSSLITKAGYSIESTIKHLENIYDSIN